MLGRDARGGASQSAQGASAGRSAAEREREERMQQLAAWRLQKEQQKRSNPAEKTAAPRPGKQPFNTMATSAQSDAEKQRLLQRRKELMRAPSAKKTAQQAAKDAQLQRQERRANSITDTASVASTTDEGEAHGPGHADAALENLIDSRENAPLEPPPASVAAQPAAPSSLPPSQETSDQRTMVIADTRPVSRQHGVSPLTQRATPPEQASARAQPPFSPSKQRPVDSRREKEQHMESPPAVNVPVHQSPALYVPRPPPPRVVRLPEALVVDKRPPVRPPVTSPPVVQIAAAPMPPPQTSPETHTPPVGSPGSASSVKTAILKTQPSPSKAAKQVRFADQVDETPEHNTTNESSSRTEHGNGASEGAHGCGDEEEEQRDPLMESQSSVDRDIQQTEVLMSEVDELLSFHKEETTVTDHRVHLHRDDHGDELIEGEIVVTRTEETSLVHVEEESVVVDSVAVVVSEPSPLPVVVNEPSPRTVSEPEAIRAAAEAPTQPTDHTKEDSFTRLTPSGRPPRSPKLYVARPPVAAAAGEVSTPRPLPHAFQQSEQAPSRASKAGPSKRRKIDVRKVVELSLVVVSIVLLDHFYPWSPVSKGIRVAIRAAGAVAMYLTSRVVNWLWKNVLRPTTESTCAKLADADAVWSPSARALQSLVEEGREGLPSIFPGTQKLPVSHYARVIFQSISSKVADVILYVARPLLKPLPEVDPTATAAVHRLEDLDDAQQHLEVKVKEILRTHEEWALAELERMKRRRVTYATATKSILHETSKTMLEAVREAKLAAAEHIQAFTNQLAGELMVSIQPNLEEYERSQADASREHTKLDAELKKEKLEAAARLEILRIEVAKKQASAKLGEDAAAVREQLASDVVAEEVDVMEVVEAAEEVIGGEAIRAVEDIEASFEATIEQAMAIAKEKEAEVDSAAIATERDVDEATKEVLGQLEEDVAARKEELRRKHDAVKDEIQREANAKLEILEAELQAAEELARERIRAEESLLQETAEAQRALDELFLEDAEKLESELLAAAEEAAAVEVAEVEQVVTENELVKKTLENEVVEEIESLVAAIDETDSEIVSSVSSAEAILSELEVAAEETIEAIAIEETQRQEAERLKSAAAIDSVAAQVEQAIASSAGVENPSELLSGTTHAKAIRPATTPVPVAGKIYDETELRHMVMLSVGFVVLGIVTAFVLYPRYVRLAVVPAKDPKQWTQDRRRRRRRRSWQRAAELTDSEVEEVILLQTGSSSDDELSNEPEPEVVEFMSGGSETPDRSWQTTSTTTSSRASYYSRELAEENERPQAAQRHEEEGEDEQASDTPQRRGLRRRTRRAV